MNQSDKVWLACAIDGEGSITFGVKSPKYYGNLVSLVIYNTSEDFVKNCKRIAKVGHVRAIAPRGNWKRMYHFEIWRHNDILQVLKNVLPFLIIKKEKAEKAIKLIEEHQWRFTFQNPETKRCRDAIHFILKNAREGASIRRISKMVTDKFGLKIDFSGSCVWRILKKHKKHIRRRCRECGVSFVATPKNRFYCSTHYRGKNSEAKNI